MHKHTHMHALTVTVTHTQESACDMTTSTHVCACIHTCTAVTGHYSATSNTHATRWPGFWEVRNWPARKHSSSHSISAATNINRQPKLNQYNSNKASL